MTLDGGVILFALLATLLTAVGVGAVTLLAWGTEEPAQALARLGRAVAARTGILRRGMVVAQVAMALVMVTGLGLLVRSFQKMQAIDPGVRTESVIVGSIGQLSRSRYPDDASRSALVERLQARIRAVPGIEGVAVASYLPSEDAARTRQSTPSTIRGPRSASRYAGSRRATSRSWASPFSRERGWATWTRKAPRASWSARC